MILEDEIPGSSDHQNHMYLQTRWNLVAWLDI